MILFHGTSEINGNKILSAKCIKINSSSPYSDKSGALTTTTRGYIYLTNHFVYAMKFAHAAINISEESYCYIFKCIIDETMLCPDNDELILNKNKPTDDYAISLKLCGAVSINSDISLDTHCVDYIKFNHANNFSNEDLREATYSLLECASIIKPGKGDLSEVQTELYHQAEEEFFKTYPWVPYQKSL